MSFACKCMAPIEFDSIFEGMVTNIKINSDDEFSQIVSFDSIKLIQGKPLISNKIYNSNVLLCGYNFKIGSIYKVFVINKPRPHTKYCYGTKLK